MVGASDGFAELLGWRPSDLVGVDARELAVDHARASERAAELERAGSLERIAEWSAHRDGTVNVAFAAQRVGELYVALGKVVPATFAVADLNRARDRVGERASAAVARSHELAAILVGEEWLTVEQATDYTQLSRATLERLEHDGRLRRGGTTGRPLYKRKWLDAALGAGLALLVAVALILAGVIDHHGRLHVRHARILASRDDRDRYRDGGRIRVSPSSPTVG
jgi:hypothetical protein